MQTFSQKVHLPVSQHEAFAWHARPGALLRLLPPWERIEVVQLTPNILPGARAELVQRLGPFRQRWIAEHDDYTPDASFHDSQVTGPFARFGQDHVFDADGPDRCWMTDRVEFELPGGPIVNAALGSWVRSQLQRMFDFRHAVTAGDLTAHHRWRDRPRLKILISGGSGLIGSALGAYLSTGGHEVWKLVRGAPQSANEIAWDPTRRVIALCQLENFDAVIHLGGANLAERRWTPSVKANLRASRVDATQFLAESLAQLKHPPKTFLCGSAVGYYGDRSDEQLDERTAVGTGFLAQLCADWEAACEPARQRGVRTANLRFGIVLSGRGGALATMLPVFSKGLGGPFGAGQQYWSWIALDDVLDAIQHCLFTDSLAGPINFVAPQAVTNRDFARTLARVLHRPAWMRVPPAALRIAIGEMADESLLSSCRAIPNRLIETDFTFRFPTVEAALQHECGRTVVASPMSAS